MIATARSFLTTLLDAHGGVERWRTFDRVSAKVVSGGCLWAMKGIPLDDAPRRMTSDFSRQRTRTEPFGDPDWHMTYQPDRVTISTAAGAVVAEQLAPRETFAGHAWESPWTPLQLGYFNGYAMWNYYNLPFLLGEPGVETTDIASVTLEGRPLRGLQAEFPTEIHTHCPRQQFYFDDEGLLRRHDYQVDVAGGARAAHFVSDYVEVQGIRLPTRRRVFLVNGDGTVATDRVLVSVDLSAFELTPAGHGRLATSAALEQGDSASRSATRVLHTFRPAGRGNRSGSIPTASDFDRPSGDVLASGSH